MAFGEDVQPRPWDPVVEAVMMEDEGEAARWLAELLDGGADPNVIDPVRGQCAIEAAWELGRAGLVEILLDRGAVIDLVKTDYSCLFSWDCIECARVVLEHGFRFDRFIVRNPLGEPVIGGTTHVLDWVLSERDLERLELFMGFGLLDLIDVFEGSRTPLVTAIDEGRHDDARWLLKHGANVNAYCEHGADYTALDYAIERHDSEAIELLIRLGGNPNIPTMMQTTAAERAVRAHADGKLDRSVAKRVIDAAAAFPDPVFPTRRPIPEWPPRLS
jgi:hypothetical protein